MPKRKAYTVCEKLNLVIRIRKGESQCKVFWEIRGWLKDEVKLQEFVHTVQEDDGLRRKKTRIAKDSVLDNAILNWFIQERKTGLLISGPVVKAQVEKFSHQRCCIGFSLPVMVGFDDGRNDTAFHSIKMLARSDRPTKMVLHNFPRNLWHTSLTTT